MRQLSELNGLHPNARTYAADERLPIPRGVIGIEVELEGVRVANVSSTIDESFWTISEDGSLRNNGVEFISKPLFGKDIFIALDNLEAALGGRYTISERCGLHIHLDVTGLSVRELVNLTVMVVLLEDALFRYVAVERRENIFCLPLYVTEDIVKWYNNIKYENNTDVLYEAINATNKYSAFNILPILKQGSVEFRHHHGTASKDDILNWIVIIQNILLLAVEWDATDVINLPYYEMVERVFANNKLLYDVCDKSFPIPADSWLMAKDLLNFRNIDARFNQSASVYGDVSSVFYQGAV